MEGTIDVGGPGPEPPVIRLREERMRRLLGMEIPPERSREILVALEFEVADAPDGLDVRPPAFRRVDVTREADVIEEVARLYGLEHLPATLPARRAAVGRLPRPQKLRRRVQDVLADRGLNEIAGWSMVSPDVAARLRIPGEPALRLENPMSEEQSLLRTQLLSSLLDVLRRNAAHGMPDAAIFEIGAVYEPRDDAVLPREPLHLGAALRGALRPPVWRGGPPPRADLFAAKAELGAVLDALRVSWSVRPSGAPYLHPGRAAEVLVDGEVVGWLGEVHPLVARAWDLEEVAAFEVDLDRVLAAAPEVLPFRDLTSFPAVVQDIAVVVAEDVSAERVLEVVRAAGGPELDVARIFDVYRGEQVGQGRVSLALRLEFRAPDRTLTDEEAAERRAAIVRALAEQVGGELRG
jgi:phenylalanyl-tRNA synthetase beta chain